jgi:methyl-accepting chemotaxis protein-1 (serine sensor receptor)
MSIKNKLLLSFGLLMLILFGLSGMAMRTIASTQESFEHFVSNDFRRAGLAREVQAAADARAVAARNLLLVSEDADIAVEKQAVAQAHERVQERLGRLRTWCKHRKSPARSARCLLPWSRSRRAMAPWHWRLSS